MYGTAALGVWEADADAEGARLDTAEPVAAATVVLPFE